MAMEKESNILLKGTIAALFAVVMMFAGLYTNSVAKTQETMTTAFSTQQERVLNHETRITTLEESKRNTEQMLVEIKIQLQRIESAIQKSNNGNVR